jgi:hypothetical protein
MYKKSKYKRVCIHIRKFIERIVLPITISVLILFGLFIGVILMGIKFSTPVQMILIIIGGILIFGEIVFRISKYLVQKLMKK